MTEYRKKRAVKFDIYKNAAFFSLPIEQRKNVGEKITLYCSGIEFKSVYIKKILNNSFLNLQAKSYRMPQENEFYKVCAQKEINLRTPIYTMG